MGNINCKDVPATAPMILRNTAKRGTAKAKKQIIKVIATLTTILLVIIEHGSFPDCSGIFS